MPLALDSATKNSHPQLRGTVKGGNYGKEKD
jgi:hypothetical protein